MPAIKQQGIKRFLQRPDPAYKTILLYGPDSGLVTERADMIARNCGVDPGDAFSNIRLDADGVASDPGRLIDEAQTINMFGGERLIRISGTTRKNLSAALKPVVEESVEGAWIIVESADLKKGAGIRNLFERSKSALAIACYMDEGAALDELVEEEIVARGINISRQTRQYLKQFLGADRLASRNELSKLALYAQNENEISEEHIQAIVGDASTIDVSHVLDDIASGRMETLEENLERLVDQGTAPDMLIIAAQRHFQQLHEICGKIEYSGSSASSVVNGIRPPVFWKRKDRLTKIVSKLSISQLDRILSRLQQAAFEARAKPELGHAIAGTCMLAILFEVRRR